MSEQPVAQWRDAFVNSESTDPNVKEQAQTWMSSCPMDWKHRLDVFITLTAPTEPAVVQRMAILGIEYILKSEWKGLPDHCREVPEIVTRLKDLVFGYISTDADDVNLWYNRAVIFALMYSVIHCPGALQELIERLERAVAGNSSVEVIHILHLFTELLAIEAFTVDPAEGAFLQRCFMEALRVAELDDPKQIYIAMCYMKNAIDKTPNVIALEEIPNVIRVTGAKMLAGDLNISTCCSEIQYNLLTKFYANAAAFVDQIMECSMAVMSNPNRDLKKVIFAMWKYFADFEAKEKASHICMRAIETLVDPVVREHFYVDPADTAVENPATINETVTAKGVQMLMSFCECEPEAMLAGITPIFDGFSTAGDWVSQHAALLLGQSFCGDRVREDQRNRPAPPIIDFLMNKVFKYAIHITKTTDVPRLKETSLYIIALILEALACEFGKMRKPDAVGMITEIVGSFDDKIGNPIIMTRYCGIIYQLCKLWKDNIDFSAIEEFFDQFGQMLSTIMGMPITSDHEKDRFTQAYEALNRLVMYAPQSKVPQLSGLYMGTLGNMHTMMQSTESDAVKFVKIAGMCSNLTSLVVRFGKDVPEDAFRQTLTMLFTILSRREVSIYEEGVMTLTSMVMQQPQLITADDCRTMCGIIHGSLESGTPGVINAAAVLIGDLFRHKTQDVLELFPDMFNKLFGLLADSGDMRDVHPFIVKAIAEMVESCAASMRDPGLPDNDAGDEARRTLAPFEEQYITMMKNMRAMVINVDDSKSVEYANYLYEFLAKAYRVYGLVYAIDIGKKTRAELSPEEQQRERGMLLELDAFARMVYRLGNKASDYLLLEFSKMLKIFASKCSRRNNVILNRVSVHNVLKLGANDRARPQKVQKELKTTISRIKAL